MNIYYENEFLLTLYAYLRQAELSLDRGMGECANVKGYFKDRNLSDGLVKVLNSSSPYHCNKFKKSILFIFFRRKQQLNAKERFMVCRLLESFGKILSDELSNKDDLIELRMKLFEASRLVRKRIRNRKLVLLADRVEHFNQSDYGIFYNIEQIVSE
ncbi:hypothetical protein [Xenorhabdus szentirmaii]|uniref:hypothetical protein n=1 Tax=Xenorhabdus szentirmaii TaxID=290112 RepID=UPI0019B755E7|nr:MULTISPECIES: hypothetical protein [unclassified Xenorhabdus]MBD2792014.1 hypothetical protein [Xenorhabdus sp. CUL]MBD2823685.1 hypothetical protein [Xenorhabdus sp. 5]